jgi:hypothetical protein
MEIKEVLDGARKAVGKIVSKLPRKGLRRKPAPLTPSSRGGSAEDGDSSFSPESGLVGIALQDDGFPGFAPPPGFKDRLMGSLESAADKIRTNPRFAAIAAGCLSAVVLLVLIAAFTMRPPKPIEAAKASDPSAVELLRLIPVPLVDPLAQSLPLDRPRKDRYTDAEVSHAWMDLGSLPTAELEAKNRAELMTILSAMEKP